MADRRTRARDGVPVCLGKAAREPGALPAGRAVGEPLAPAGFDLDQFLGTAGRSRRIVTYRRGQTIFHQGDPADAVLFIQSGTVKLSVVSGRGKEAVVAVLGPGAFFGEGALTGTPRRLGHATALDSVSVLAIDKDEMTQRLAGEPTLASRFIEYLLARNVRVEADLVDHLFNVSERRLARILLLLARYGTGHAPHRTLPRVSQEMLAEMVGTTRSRVNFFMNKFRRLGFVEYNGEIKVHSSLLDVVLCDNTLQSAAAPDGPGAPAVRPVLRQPRGVGRRGRTGR
jgi:CRP-like cAMP-binding protein